jgi:conjugal transfer pilus assembly protein TraU
MRQMLPNNLFKWAVVTCFALSACFVSAQETTTTTEETSVSANSLLCPNAKLFSGRLFTDVCWSCMLPIRVFGQFGDNPPRGANTNPVCSCKDSNSIPHFGVSAGFTLPTKIVETVKTPFCSPFLAGKMLSGNAESVPGTGQPLLDVGGGRGTPGSDASELTRYQVHAFQFPLLTIMGFVTELNCINGGFASIEIAGAPTEFIPNWNDEELGLFIAPESILTATPVAQLACGLTDCPAASIGEPIEELWWCAGCWGSNYPLSGNISDPLDPIRESSLLMSRYLTYNHRMGVFGNGVGKTAACGDWSYAYTAPKQQYKFSMMYPVPEADPGRVASTPAEGELPDGGSVDSGDDLSAGSGKTCCHDYGEHPWLWGLGRKLPGAGENFVTLLWQYRDCCVILL